MVLAAAISFNAKTPAQSSVTLEPYAGPAVDDLAVRQERDAGGLQADAGVMAGRFTARATSSILTDRVGSNP